VFAKYGFAACVQRGSGLVSTRVMQGVVDRPVDPQIVSMSDDVQNHRSVISRNGARETIGLVIIAV
jgi:hypothetical protein